MPMKSSLVVILVIANLVIMLAAGCSTTPNVRITRQEYGDQWPFTVDEGVLSCKKIGYVGNVELHEVLFTTNGVTYAVNGTARSNKAYADVREIWADDQYSIGPKKNIGPIIDRGLSLVK